MAALRQLRCARPCSGPSAFLKQASRVWRLTAWRTANVVRGREVCAARVWRQSLLFAVSWRGLARPEPAGLARGLSPVALHRAPKRQFWRVRRLPASRHSRRRTCHARLRFRSGVHDALDMIEGGGRGVRGLCPASSKCRAVARRPAHAPFAVGVRSCICDVRTVRSHFGSSYGPLISPHAFSRWHPLRPSHCGADTWWRMLTQKQLFLQ